MQLGLLTALAWTALDVVHAQGPPVMEIEFEPVGFGPGGDDRPPQDLLQDVFASMDKPPSSSGGPDAKREGELDRVMAQMMGGKQSNKGHGAAGGPQTSSWTSPDGSRHVFVQEFPMSHKRSRLPVDLFHDLFPGPLMMEDAPEPMGSTPFGSPDPLIMDMLQGMSQAFQQDMLPAVHRASGGTRAPRSCHNDLSKHCSRERSQVHCLGQHQGDISEACRKDVGKSVPFVCSAAIDRYCDVLQVGILTCLNEHLKELDSQCSDAVIATRHVIDKANSQKASVKVKSEERATQPPAATVATLRADATAPPGTRSDDNGMKMFESTADLVAEATDIAKQAAAQQAPQQSSSFLSWKLLVCALLVGAAVYTWAFTDSSQRVYSAFKPFMAVDEDSKPLRGGVELPKPVAI